MMKTLNLFLLFMIAIMVGRLEAKNMPIKHHYIDAIAKSHLQKNRDLIEIRYLSCSPDAQNKIWICYVEQMLKEKINCSLQSCIEKATLVINFLDNKFTLYEDYIREF